VVIDDDDGEEMESSSLLLLSSLVVVAMEASSAIEVDDMAAEAVGAVTVAAATGARGGPRCTHEKRECGTRERLQREYVNRKRARLKWMDMYIQTSGCSTF